ncbi:MAG: alpha/beta hydrolase [Peptococcaceae bacterium]|jgi:pimeloyl-ACP methyl ester carboxylesterase|nr:alpha/beta hydrolase [Peptococcaceae bacterium]
MDFTLNVSGMDISYMDSAPDGGDRKPVLLLLHGWGADNRAFIPVIDALSGQYRLIAPDLPGFGKTGEPDKPWSLTDYVDWLQAFADGLGLAEFTFTACGHSHGGRTLIKWAARSPAGLGRLILIDSAGLKPKRGLAWYTKVYAYKAGKKLLQSPGIGKMLAPFAAGKLANAGSADYRQASPLMRRTMVLLLEEDLGHCLSQIRVPTLIFWGEQDQDTPLSMGKRMEQDIPDAGLVVLSPAGHYSYLDQLPVFLSALRYFLDH